jgi:hypothetical protein
MVARGPTEEATGDLWWQRRWGNWVIGVFAYVIEPPQLELGRRAVVRSLVSLVGLTCFLGLHEEINGGGAGDLHS